MLGKKKSIKNNDDWLKALEDSVKLYTKDEIDNLQIKTSLRIKNVTSKYKNIFIGINGGKDSQVVRHIVEKTEIKVTPIIWKGINNWPEVERWYTKNLPKKTLVKVIDKFDFEFLNEHPEYLFCPNAEIAQKWMRVKWARYKKDLAELKADLFITGRRVIDGNVCGKSDEDFVKKKRKIL